MGVEEEPTGGGRGREGGRGRRGGNKAVEGQPDQQKHCEKTSLQLVFARGEARFMRRATAVVLMGRPGTTLQYLVL